MKRAFAGWWLAVVFVLFLQGCESLYVKPETPNEAIGLSAAYIGAMADSVASAKRSGLINDTQKNTLLDSVQVAKDSAQAALDALNKDVGTDVTDKLSLARSALSGVREILIAAGASVPEG